MRAVIPIHVLWARGPLPFLARLALASYHRHGCAPTLWTYDPLGSAPDMPGVTQRDAREIMAEPEFLRFAFNPSGQLALAADRFAWEVLYMYGGWWGHLDCTLLRPLTSLDHLRYVFGPHHRHVAGMPLWKAPKESDALAHMRYLADNRTHLPPYDWHAMMKVAEIAIRKYNLLPTVRRDLHNDDGDERPMVEMMHFGSRIPEGWEKFTAIHWCGSGVVRSMPVPEPGSVAATLAAECGMAETLVVPA